MDSRAYLTRLGWGGEGHSLDQTGRGIKKPLLVSKKVDVLGVGLNKHAAVSDQWWLRAYDQGLKNLGTGNQSMLANVQKLGHSRAGLYGRFVKGDGVPGTFGGEPKDASGKEAVVGEVTAVAMSTGKGDGKKRKREGGMETKSTRRKTGADEQELYTVHGNGSGISSASGTQPERITMDEVDRRANELVLEAQRLGLLTSGPSVKRKSIAESNNPSSFAWSEGTVAKLVAQAGLSSKTKKKDDVYSRESTKRKLKRAGKAYLLGPKVATETKRDKKLSRVDKTDTRETTGSKPRLHVPPGANIEASSLSAKPRKLSPAKLAEYTQRAQEKGVPLEVYMQRRDEKNAAKQAEKVGGLALPV